MQKQVLIKKIIDLDTMWHKKHKGSLIENVYIGETELTDIQEVKNKLLIALKLKEEIGIDAETEKQMEEIVNEIIKLYS